MSAAYIREELGQSEHTSKLAALEQLALRPPDSTELSPAAKSASHALSVRRITPIPYHALLIPAGWLVYHRTLLFHSELISGIGDLSVPFALFVC